MQPHPHVAFFTGGAPRVGWLGEGENNQEKVGGGFSEAHSYPFHEFTLAPALGPFESYKFSVTPF